MQNLSGPYGVKNTHKTLIFLTFIEHTTVLMKGEKVTKKSVQLGFVSGCGEKKMFP